MRNTFALNFGSWLSVGCGRLQCYPADGSNGARILCIIWISSYKFFCSFQVW